MPQLIVRKIEQEVVRKLRARAASHGVSMEEEHRRVLREALTGARTPKKSFADFLLSIPPASAAEPPDLFARRQELPRKIRL